MSNFGSEALNRLDKVFYNNGYTVVSNNGTKIFDNIKHYSNDCLFTKNKGKEYFSHSCTVISLIGDNANIVIDYE